MSDAEVSSPLALDLVRLISGIITDCDELLADLRERQHRLSENDPAWSAIMAMRLKGATLRGTAWNATAVVTALKATLRSEMMPPRVPVRPQEHEVLGTQPSLSLDVKMRQAGDHSLDADDGEEDRA